MSRFLNENHRGSPTLTLLNVLGVLGVLNVLNVLACWALFYTVMSVYGENIGRIFIQPLLHRGGPVLIQDDKQGPVVGQHTG